MRTQSAQEYDAAYAQADRQALTRGMQRSSFNNQTLSNIDLQGAQTQERITERQGGDQNQSESQRAVLARQLGDQMTQLSASEIADKLAYIDQLEAREYDRIVANQDRNNALTQSIYGASQSEAAQTNSFNQWAAEFSEGSKQFYDQLGYNAALANWQGENQYGLSAAQLAENQRQFNEQINYDATKSNWSGLNDYNKWSSQLAETQRQFNESSLLDIAKSNWSGQNQFNQWSATFEENQRQFLENQLFQGAQNNWAGQNDYNQWTTQLSESQRQYDQTFQENVRQFGLDYALKQQQLGEQARQFDMDYALSQQSLALQQQAAAAASSRASSSSGTGGTGGTGGKTNPGLTQADLNKAISDALGALNQPAKSSGVKTNIGVYSTPGPGGDYWSNLLKK